MTTEEKIKKQIENGVWEWGSLSGDSSYWRRRIGVLEAIVRITAGKIEGAEAKVIMIGDLTNDDREIMADFQQLALEKSVAKEINPLKPTEWTPA